MRISTIVAGLLLSSTLFGENLVKNGSFENFDKENIYKWSYVHFDNWEGVGEVWTKRFGRVAVDGTHKIELDTTKRHIDSLSQTITTEAGKKYLFRLDAYARSWRDTNAFELLVDDEVILRVTPTRHWQKYGATFIGKGGEQKITIREIPEQSDGLGAVIDNVVVQSDITNLDEIKMQERAKYEILDPTNLDQITEIIDNEKRLNAELDSQTIQKAKDAALRMNELIREAIKVNGLANDKKLTGSDAREISNYLYENYKDEWSKLKEEFNVVRENGRYKMVKALGRRAIIDVWSKIYNLGFGAYSNNERYLTDRNGNRSISFRRVAFFLDSIVDKEEVINPDFKEVKGTTNTAMDKIVEVILKDRGLNTYVATSDLRFAAKMADEMNKLILEAIKNEGLANDGVISPADVRTINRYLVEKYQDRWAELHGDDEENEETGYHRVQNDGATTRMFGENVINTIADGIYHLGYPTPYKYRLVNEDGNKNQKIEDVAWWLTISLKEDIKAGKLNNPDYKEVVGTTGTSLDKIINAIYSDEGLQRKVSMDDIRIAARNANRMNELIIEAIKATGVAQDRYISIGDVKKINRYLVENYQSEWAELHGDDETNEETGFHRIQNDGAVSQIEGHNLINRVADGIYHLGYPTRFKHNLENEDGNKNVSFYSVAYWFNKYMKKDLEEGKLSQ